MKVEKKILVTHQSCIKSGQIQGTTTIENQNSPMLSSGLNVFGFLCIPYRKETEFINIV